MKSNGGGDGESISSFRSRTSGMNASGSIAGTQSAKRFHLSLSSTAQFFTKRFPLFPAFLSFNTSVPQVFVVLGLIVYAGQYWSFVINPHYADVWGDILGRDAAQMLFALQIPLYDPLLLPATTIIANIVMSYVVLLMVLTLYGLVLTYLLVRVDGDEPRPVFVHSTKILVDALTTFLLIPVLQTCFAGMVCGESGYLWLHAHDRGAECWGAYHIVSFIGSGLALLLLLPIVFLSIACNCELHARDVYMKTLRHPYVDLIVYFHTLLSCVLWSITLGWKVRGVFAAIHAVSSAMVALSYMLFLPYYAMIMNRFFVVVHSIECVASVFATAGATNLTFRSSDVASVLLLGAAPVIGCVASSFTSFRVNDKLRFELQRIMKTRAFPVYISPSEGDVTDEESSTAKLNPSQSLGGSWSRAASVKWCKMSSVSARPWYPYGMSTSRLSSPFPDVEAQLKEVVAQREYDSMMGTGDCKDHTHRMDELMEPYISRVYVPTDVNLAVGFFPAFVQEFGVVPVGVNMLIYAVNMFAKGMQTFPSSSQVPLDCASFLAVYSTHLSFVGIDMVRMVVQNETSTVIQQYFAVKLSRDLRAKLGIRNQTHLVHSARARYMYAKVLSQMNSFWMKLTEPSVNIKEVSDVADEIHTSRKEAVAQFERALKHQTVSDAILVNRLGDFFSDVLIDRAAAQECYNETHEIYEAKQARSMRGTKKTTAMELDVGTLTDRLTQLLHNQSKSQEAAGSSSSAVRNLLLAVTVLFFLMVIVGSLFIVAAVMTREEILVLSHVTDLAAVLRRDSIRFLSVILGSNLADNQLQKTEYLQDAISIADSFSTSLILIARSIPKIKSAAFRSLYYENCIALHDPMLSHSNGQTLVNLGSSTLAAMKAVLDTGRSEGMLPDVTTDAAAFIGRSTVATSSAFNYSVHLGVTSESVAIRDRLITWSVTLFAVGMILLVLIALSFFIGFRQTGIARIFTFQLFTLIPYDALEKLATDTKEKVHQMALERSLRQPKHTRREVKGNQSMQSPPHPSLAPAAPVLLPPLGLPANETVATTGAGSIPASDGQPPGDAASEHLKSPSKTLTGVISEPVLKQQVASSYPIEVAPQGSSEKVGVARLTVQSGALKSCLKKTDGTAKKQNKVVHFNPEVQYVGSGMDGDDCVVTHTPGGRSRPGDSVEGEVENDLNTGSLERPVKKRRFDQLRSDLPAIAPKFIVILYYFIVVAATVVSTILLGFAVGKVSTLIKTTEDYFVAESIVQFSSRGIDLIPPYATRFINSGDVVYAAITLEDILCNVIRETPTYLLQSTSVGDATQLIVMRESAKEIYQLLLHSYAISINAKGLSFSTYTDLSNVADVPLPQLVTEMSQRYPRAAERSAGVATASAEASAEALAHFIFGSAYIPMQAQYSSNIQQLLQAYYSRFINSVNHLLLCPEVIVPPALLGTAMVLSLLMPLAFGKQILDWASSLLVFTAFAVPTVLCIFVCLSGSHLVSFISDLHEVTLGLERVEDAARRSYQATNNFIFGGSAEAWVNVTLVDIVKVIQDFGIVLSTNAALQETLADYVAEVHSSFTAIETIHNASFALAFMAPTTELLTNMMEEALTYSYWDISHEADYPYFHILYPEDTNVYTNKSFDTNRLPEEMLSIAVNTITSQRYTKYRTDAQEALGKLHTAISTYEKTQILDRLHRHQKFIIAALALCLFPIVACALMAIRIGHIFRSLMGTQDKSTQVGKTTGQSRYTALVKRAQYSLTGLAFLFSVTFGLGIAASLTLHPYMAQQNTFSMLSFLASGGLMYLRELALDAGVYTSPQIVGRICREEQEALLQFLTSSNAQVGVVSTVTMSPEFVYSFFGTEDYEPLETISRSHLRTNCSAPIDGISTLPMLPTVDYGGGLSIPVGAVLNVYFSVLRQAAGAVTLAASDVNVTDLVAPYSSLLLDMEPRLTRGLQESIQLYFDSSTAQSIVLVDAFMALGITALTAAILVYLCIVLPTIRALYSEEDAARMLLQMIPLAVREQVPAISQFIEAGRISNAAELQRKFEASERLLHNILPNKIAERLKSGEQPIADMHKCVTILFTDFVGFTNRSSSMQAREIVDFLNEVFLDFDTVVELLGLEKIKTIGDAFFMVGGLDSRTADHAMRVIEAGLMFFQALEEHNARHPTRVPLRMRLGIHTGPAVAGVIGIKKVAYDLWGDSVDIANAMESTGVPGFVHISEPTAQLVKGYYRLEPRGKLHCDKEHIPENMPPTYLVTGRLLPSPYMYLRIPKMVRAKIGKTETS